MKSQVLFILLMVGFVVSGYSQEPTDTTKKIMIITKHDGTEYIGYIISDNGREILIMTKELGKLYIDKSEIASIKELNQEELSKKGVYDPSGVFTTRYYFTNNALPIEKRDNYAMVHLYGPEIHFAPGGGFSAGLMTTWGASPFIAVFKQSIKTKNAKVNFSLGTIFGTSGYLNTFRGWGGMHWATFTYGTPKNNFSFSGGYLYIQPGFKDQEFIDLDDGVYSQIDYPSGEIYRKGKSEFFKTPMFGIGGIGKIGKKASFIFDSMVSIRNSTETTVDYFQEDVNDDGNIEYPTDYFFEVKTSTKLTTMFFVMPGMRFQKSDRKAFQVALAGVIYIKGNETIAFPVPMCSWFFKF